MTHPDEGELLDFSIELDPSVSSSLVFPSPSVSSSEPLGRKTKNLSDM